jgi:hypothetical protein
MECWSWTNWQQYIWSIYTCQYEWAPMDRLGLEVDYLFNLLSYKREPNHASNKLNSFKLAAQYSFYVMKTQDEYGFWIFIQTAIRYYGKENFFNLCYNVAASWFGNGTTLYTGTRFIHHFSADNTIRRTQVVIMLYNFTTWFPGTRNFIGLSLIRQLRTKI